MSPPVYAFGDVVPVVHPTAFVHPTASLIGDIIIGPGCYVGPQASLRGDLGRFVMKEGANLQDGCIVHTFPGRLTEVGTNGHVGHGAILHGCHVGDSVLIGIGAVVLDGSIIGEQAFVGAGSLVTSNTEIPARHLAYGTPAKVVRELTQAELTWKAAGTATYHWLTHVSAEQLTETEPLTQEEANRPTLVRPLGSPNPLHETRAIAES
jgi:phenylacetic acid degradation protein